MEISLRIVLFIFFATSWNLALAEAEQEFYVFKGQNRSLISWKDLDADEWLNLESWKIELVKKKWNPLWREKLRDSQHRELMGRVLSCLNECRIFRGPGFVNASFRSSLREGDEVRTNEDSYAWIYLVNGALLRLSPQTSVRFKEVNIGSQETFLLIRLSEGMIFYLTREEQLLADSDLPETDDLFLPLRLFEANDYQLPDPPYSEGELWKYLEEEEDKDHNDKFKRLNERIKKNNRTLIPRTAYTMIVMPNGSIMGKNLRLQALTFPGYQSFVKQRSSQSLGFLSGSRASSEKVEFAFRGHHNRQTENLDEDVWYQVSEDGKEISPYPKGNKQFAIQDFLIQRIPTLLSAREIWLKRYSAVLFEPEFTEKKLILQYGYRPWGSMDKSNSNNGNNGNKEEKSLLSLRQRINFLKEYERRIETTNLYSLKKYIRLINQDEEENKDQNKDKEKNSSSPPAPPSYSSRFHHLAFTHYLRKMAKGFHLTRENNEEGSNKAQQKIWHIKNAAGNP